MSSPYAHLLAMALALQAPPSDPSAAVEDLLAADRAFSAASAATDPASGISAMFAEDVRMPLPGGGFAEGRAAATAALRTSATDPGARAEWRPVRGGVSADGLHGFTFGYMTVTTGDGSRTPMKYLSYWVKGSAGWRVAAYKRVPRPAGDVATEPLPPSLPDRLVPAVGDAGRLADLRASLARAEQAFSDEAQRVGLGRAFAAFGRPDAMNMGGPNDAGFVLGAERIARAVGGGREGPSPVSWSADHVLVASSGDLGVTFGVIRVNQPVEGQPSGFPFFTIWRRDAADSPWRYIAE